MKCIILAGQDPEVAKERIRAREKAEGESYLWGEYKPITMLEDLNHNRKTLIEMVVDNVRASNLEFVVVGRPQLLDHIDGEVFVPQGASFGDNIRLGRERLATLCDLPPEEYVLVLPADLVLADAKLLNDVVSVLTPVLNNLSWKPNTFFTYADERIVGNLLRRYVPVWNDLYRDPEERCRIKECNIFFATQETKYDVLSALYSRRKLKEFGNVMRSLDYAAGKLSWRHLVWQLARSLKLKHGKLGAQLSVLNEILAELMGEKAKDGSVPIMLSESLWPELSWDIDSEQDISRFGFTSVGKHLEYKSRVVPKAGYEREFMKFYGAKGKLHKFFKRHDIKAFSVKDVLNPPSAGFFIVRTEDTVHAARLLDSKEYEQLTVEAEQYVKSTTPLGWYGL